MNHPGDANRLKLGLAWINRPELWRVQLLLPHSGRGSACLLTARY